MSEFVMPSLGADMDSGILTEWKVKSGDKVKKGDIVASVETQKGIIEIEIFEDGIIEKLVIEPGKEVPVGGLLALVKSEEDVTEIVEKPVKEELKLPEIKNLISEPLNEEQHIRIHASPAARQKARELGISLEKIKGTGPRGAISIEDIEKYTLAEKSSQKPSFTAKSMRDAIATSMSRSKREIPHYYLGHTIDMSIALNWLQRVNCDNPITERLVYAIVLLKAVAIALKKYKDLNGYYKEGKFVHSEDINVGMAISLRQGGLVAPALLNADRKDIFTLMKEFSDLVNRARIGQLKASEMSGGTITVTNLGEQGVESVYPVIYPPQVAMVGFGTIMERPWVIDGQVLPAKVITASLAGDHRVTDGHYGAKFIAYIEKLLQTPEEL